MINSVKKRVLVAAGGSGGHVFPALVVADSLVLQGYELLWLGTSNNIESVLVPKHGINIKFIKINGLIGKGFIIQLITLFRIFFVIFQVRKIMIQWLPDVVLCMGGYVSGPVGVASWLLGIPLVLHEQNSIAGFANRLLSRIANKTLQAFPNVSSNFGIVVGNPLRSEILNLSLSFDRFRYRDGPIRILVMGGSQGADIFNQIIPVVTYKLAGKFIVWHQTGVGKLNRVIRDYAIIQQLVYRVEEFIENIALAYSWADLVVCRAGALTVSELSAVGLPAVFVPFIHKDQQQYFNAQQLQQTGAAIIIEQKNFTVDRVTKELVTLLDRALLLKMGRKSKSFAVLDATERVLESLINFCI